MEFGRRAIFYVRVLSGYEERRIRSYRLQLQNRLQQVSYFMSVYSLKTSSCCCFCNCYIKHAFCILGIWHAFCQFLTLCCFCIRLWLIWTCFQRKLTYICGHPRIFLMNSCVKNNDFLYVLNCIHQCTRFL